MPTWLTVRLRAVTCRGLHTASRHLNRRSTEETPRTVIRKGSEDGKSTPFSTPFIYQPFKSTQRISTPDGIKIRHLLRSLLRETAYLPDSFAREWTKKYILERFRRYTFRAWQKRDDTAFDWDSRIKAKIKEAQYGANQLRRANEGDKEALLNVLARAYGRSGIRKRHLITKLLPKAAGKEMRKLMKETKEMEDTSEMGTKDVSQRPPAATEPTDMFPPSRYVPDLTPQLRALAESQSRYAPAENMRRSNKLRSLESDIPKLNAWLRPTPQNRVKNLSKKWYAEFLHRLHAPLPPEEWDRLHGLATGTIKEETIPRRAKLGPEPSALDLVVKRGKLSTRQVLGNRFARQVTPRTLQRIWATLFKQCTRLDWDRKTKQWKVTWGEHALNRYVPETNRKEMPEEASK